MITNYYRKSINLLLICLILLLSSKVAFADLMIYPTRLVIEKNQRSTQVEIVNSGQKPATYRINVVNRRMTETGNIVEAEEIQAGENFADKMIRYSPRQITLQPGVAQTVRFSVRKPAKLTIGEYRSHIQFDRVPDVVSKSSIENIAKSKDEKISIVVQALIGASIPMIIRHGATLAKVTIDDISFEPQTDKKQPIIKFNINRTGNRSVYGDLVVNYTPLNGQSIEVSRVGGLAVYVPNAIRKTKMEIKLPEALKLQGGLLHIDYLEKADAGGRLIAQADFKL